MPLMLPSSNATDIRTPLERSVGVRPPGIYRPDGTFVPTRDIRVRDTKKALIEALKANGATVEEDSKGGLVVTPPYPPGASRLVRDRIDAHWNKRLKHVLSNKRS